MVQGLISNPRGDRPAVDELAREPERHRAMRVLIAKQVNDGVGLLGDVNEITRAGIFAPTAADRAERDARWDFGAESLELLAGLRRQRPAAADERGHPVLQRRGDVLGLAGVDDNLAT